MNKDLTKGLELKEKIEHKYLLTQVSSRNKRTCSKCKKQKSVKCFYKDNRTPSGYRCKCKLCCKKAGKIYHATSECKTRNANRNLVKKYGITQSQYDTILKQQKGKCAICGNKKHPKGRKFAVDHNHDTGEVRGILCGNCNQGIGHLKDDVKLLKRAIKYLTDCG